MMFHNHEQIGDEMLIRVMQYCDGTLDPEEAALVAQQIAGNAELQALADDLRLGASAAHDVMAVLTNLPVPIALARSTSPAPTGYWTSGKVVSVFRQQVAAAVIGLAVGAAAVGFWSASQHETGLRLAGSSENSELFSAASRAALFSSLSAKPELVNTPFNLPGQTGVQGTISVVRWFDLATGSPCAEFTQTQPVGVVASGIACRRNDGSWDLIALPVDGQ
jgi:anti-sigma factor RsiW